MLTGRNITRIHHHLIPMIAKITSIPNVCRCSMNHCWERITLTWFRDTKSHAGEKSHAGAQRSHRDTSLSKSHTVAERSHRDTSSSDFNNCLKRYDSSCMYVFNETGNLWERMRVSFLIGILCICWKSNNPKINTDTDTYTDRYRHILWTIYLLTLLFDLLMVDAKKCWQVFSSKNAAWNDWNV